MLLKGKARLARAYSRGWHSNVLTPMKLGTVPCCVLIHGTDRKRMAPGKWIRIKECEGDRWHAVLVTEINETGHVFASR
jgi:hypothetical protein